VTLAGLGLSDWSLIRLVLALRKPVIYVMPPEPTDMVVRIALSPQWLFSAVYPPATVVKDKVERIEWRVKANSNGRMKDDKGIETTYLFWEGELRPPDTADASSVCAPRAQRTLTPARDPPTCQWRTVHLTPAAPTLAPRTLSFSPHQTCQGTCTASCPSWAW
jgi:hypothetical protein